MPQGGIAIERIKAWGGFAAVTDRRLRIVGNMRILMLCTRYPLDSGDRYMTNELAAALAAAGHHVQVVVTAWDAPRQAGSWGSWGARKARAVRSQDGVEALVIAPRAVEGLGRFVHNLSKWTLSSLFALRAMRRAIGGQRFDLMLCFTPCVTVAAQLVWATKRLRTTNMLLVHDFFPYHHRSIGLVPGGPVFAAARLLETYLMRRFDVIGCNWPGNMSYLREHYRLRPDQNVVWTPLWSEIAPPAARSKDRVRSQHQLPRDRKIIVFGGQITQGRGVDEMLAAAAIAEQARPDLAFLFVGDGRLVPLIEERIASGAGNLLRKQRMARDEYLSMLAACDIGLVATVPQVDSYSFPTKTIDLSAGFAADRRGGGGIERLSRLPGTMEDRHFASGRQRRGAVRGGDANGR
jgi:glycosyltransferase involved in cell wall biosynthesis